MKCYRRVVLGRNCMHAQECFENNFIGTDFEIHQDLSGQLPDDWREFNHKFVPILLAAQPDKTKIGAGLACGMLWAVSKGIHQGDIVLCPDGSGHYHIGEVSGDYFYQPGGCLPHRRPVHWFSQTIERNLMSQTLKSSTGGGGTVCDITKYADEIERLIDGMAGPKLMSTEETVEDPAAFAMEKHLEDFLVKNWEQTEIGKEYNIYSAEGETVGQQFATDTGPIDILAVSKDNKRLLVVELKKGRASDAVVGQTLRYMGYVQDELAERDQTVHGAIIAVEDDQRIRRALAMVPAISFYRYQISFKLMKA